MLDRLRVAAAAKSSFDNVEEFDTTAAGPSSSSALPTAGPSTEAEATVQEKQSESLTSPNERSPGLDLPPNATCSFVNIPFTIQANIFAHLDHPAAVSLRRTCQHFRSNFTVSDTAAKGRVYKEELLQKDNNSFPAPCYTCLRVLPILSFDSQQPYHSPGSWYPSRRIRKCVGCSLNSNSMTRGAHFWRKRTEWVYCVQCDEIREAKPRFGDSWSSHCGKCAEKRAVKNWIWNVLSAKLTRSMACILAELATAIAVARKLYVEWKMGMSQDKVIYDWALYQVVYVAVLNLTFLILATCSEIARQKSDLWRLRQLFASQGDFVTAWSFAGVATLPWDLVHLLISIGLGFYVKSLDTLPLFSTMLLMNLISALTSIARLLVSPFERVG